MSLPRLSLLVVAMAMFLPSSPAGEGPPLAMSALPPAIAAEVVAVLRVDDPRWVSEQMNGAVGANGEMAAGARAMMAEALFNLRSMRGIDDSRPAMLAWRSGDAPLVAVVPVADRRQFLDDFGGLRLLKRLLIRTGEQEGTVVYNQVTTSGTWEYRLMMRDNYAYLARTAEECTALADRGLNLDTEAPPLRMEWRGSFLAQQASFGLDGLNENELSDQAMALAGPLMVAVDEGWRGLLEQVSLLHLEFANGERGSMAVSAWVTARADTPLATWVSRQSNSGSRLLPLVTRPGDLVTMHGSLRWQGELDRLGRFVANILRESLGRDRFTEQKEADLRSYFSLLDRQGAFALAMGLQRGDNPGIITRVISEQPNAADLITLERGLDALFLAQGEQLGEFDAVSGLLAYSKTAQETDGAVVHTLSAAARDHLLKVGTNDPQLALVEMRTLIAALGETHEPQGAAGVMALRLHVDAMIAAAERMLGNDVSKQDKLSIDLACRVDGGRRLVMDVQLPVAQIQEAVVRAGLMPSGNEGPGSSRR
ncbi:MAG: hypothetical protein PF961_09040 [Planctomycetota bacterium]|jgi:hypothetical protein|nr:hypothetical protein [Planctomycetota bacterium]